MMVRGMPKVRVGGDFRPAAFEDDSRWKVIALAATVAAIASNQEQPQGNRFHHTAPVGTMEFAAALRAILDWVDQFHREIDYPPLAGRNRDAHHTYGRRIRVACHVERYKDAAGSRGNF